MNGLDREKVKKGLEVCTRPGTRGCFYDIKECPYDENGCRMALMRDALALLKEQEPVRCKDCKFWYMDECSHLCKITGDLHPANWFCADGERKEGE